jgi:ATP-utilising chromatin assembly and remodelling N-terminal
MTYWEALKSEKQAARGVDQAFPESLKEPVLRKIQFSTVSRLDHLVENIYDQFKEDFYPGETLTVSIQGYRLPCLLREKTRFSALFLKDGTTRPAITRYRIELVSPPSKIKSYDLGPEQNVGEEQLQRDRVQFNKALIRAFIKNSCWREQWTGAPWLVKERYARRFRIDMNVPEHLRRRPKLEEKLPEQKEDRRRKKVLPLPPSRITTRLTDRFRMRLSSILLMIWMNA